jgi:hypothetical protein
MRLARDTPTLRYAHPPTRFSRVPDPAINRRAGKAGRITYQSKPGRFTYRGGRKGGDANRPPFLGMA